MLMDGKKGKNKVMLMLYRCEPMTIMHWLPLTNGTIRFRGTGNVGFNVAGGISAPATYESTL